MANPNAPFGLRPVRHYFGGVIRHNEYSIADGYATALFIGDPVRAAGSGLNIGIGTAGSSAANTGVFMGCDFVDANGDTHFQKNWPAAQALKAGTTAKAWVCDDPLVVFEVMMDTLAAVDVRLLTDLVSGTGTVANGQSGWSAAGVAGSENQLKILRLSGVIHPGGVENAYGAYAVAQVLFGKHELIALAPTEI